MSKLVEDKIAELIGQDLAAAGYDLVRVRLTGNGKYATLQVMAERLDGQGMAVEDCAKISRAISEKLEADPALADRYTLEVSSPGIDRPLVRLKDYQRFQGYEAAVELEAPLDGRKKFQGKIARVSDASVELGTDSGTVSVPLDRIAKAKLVLTDELLKAAASGKVNG